MAVRGLVLWSSRRAQSAPSGQHAPEAWKSANVTAGSQRAGLKMAGRLGRFNRGIGSRGFAQTVRRRGRRNDRGISRLEDGIDGLAPLAGQDNARRRFRLLTAVGSAARYKNFTRISWLTTVCPPAGVLVDRRVGHMGRRTGGGGFQVVWMIEARRLPVSGAMLARWRPSSSCWATSRQELLGTR